jgi:protein-S-isoprenylcysteine O-methyltransferase Ste14
MARPVVSKSRPHTKHGKIQILRKIILLVAILLGTGYVFIGASRWPSGTLAHEAIEWVGFALIVFCILGRTWSSLYIGGRKKKELVVYGPYSVTRNPLYLFSILGAIGVGAQLGSIALALTAGLITWFVFLLVVFKEEETLIFIYGKAYRSYIARVPRFFPKPSLWRDVKILEVRPNLVLSTFIDACVFLVAIPLAETLEFLQARSILPILIRFP